MKIELNLGSIAALDEGRIVAAFNKELQKCVSDCVARPDTTGARTVTLVMSVSPDGTDSVCDRVMTDFKVKSSVPGRSSRGYQVQCHPSGKLLVNPESPDDVNQMTIDEAVAGGGSATDTKKK